MKINWEKGSFFDGDRIITVTTQENEFFSIFKLALLTNQLAINELLRMKKKKYPFDNFLFKKAILSSIEQAEKGIDWGEEKSVVDVINWCKKHFLKFEKVEQELRKNIQTKIEDFKNGN